MEAAIRRLSQAEKEDAEAVFWKSLESIEKNLEGRVRRGEITRERARTSARAAERAGRERLRDYIGEEPRRPKCIIGDWPNVRPRGCTTKRGVILSSRIQEEP